MNTIKKKIYLLILRIFWEPISKKRSHGFQWVPFDGELDLMRGVVAVTGSLEAKDRDTFWRNFWETNFGWNEVAVIRINNTLLGFDKKFKSFRVGLIAEGKKEICEINFKPEQKVGLLIGPEEVRFFAIDENGEQLPVLWVSRKKKKELSSDEFLV
jgi:hypothetical protein